MVEPSQLLHVHSDFFDCNCAWTCCASPEHTHARTHARTHSLCPNRCGTAGVQLAKIESAGTAAETALLADMKAKNPGASSIELLRLVKVCCRRWICCTICCALYCVCAACCMCCICCASNRDYSRQPFVPGQTAQLHGAFPNAHTVSLASLRAVERPFFRAIGEQSS